LAAGILGGALVPHPPILLEAIGGTESKKLAKTQAAMQTVAHWLQALDADVVIIISPHGPVQEGTITALPGTKASGDFAAFRRPDVRVDMALDVALLEEIRDQADALGIRVLPTETYRQRIDHGVTVPILSLGRDTVVPPLVVLGYPALDPRSLDRLGQAITRATHRLGRRGVTIASGDLSHRLSPGAPAGYHPDAHEFDDAVMSTFRGGDVDALWHLPDEMVRRAGECGHAPLLVALAAVEAMDRPSIAVSHAYQAPFGVGYGVATITTPGYLGALDPAGYARYALRHYLHEGEPAPVPAFPKSSLCRPGACFVSLYHGDTLRGCIGTVEPTGDSLAADIARNAAAAAKRDPRFPPVTPDELPALSISVDVLGPREPTTLESLDPARYGILVQSGAKKGVLLPDIPGICSAEEQLRVACRKADLDARFEDVELFRFEVTRHVSA